MGNNFGWGFCILLVMVGALYDYKHKDEIVAYQVGCVDSTVSLQDTCTGKYFTFTTNFKASFDNQTVVSWNDYRAPTALEGCAVASTEDWQCRDKKDQFNGTTTMRKGEYLGTGPNRSNSFFTVGKWHYRWLNIKNWLRPYLPNNVSKHI